MVTKSIEEPLQQLILFDKFSSFYKFLRKTAYILPLLPLLPLPECTPNVDDIILDLSELDEAERYFQNLLQGESFIAESKDLLENKRLKRSIRIAPFSSFVELTGVVRVRVVASKDRSKLILIYNFPSFLRHTT